MTIAIIIAITSIYLIILGCAMRTDGMLFAILFKAVPIILGVILGIHASKLLGFTF